MSDPAVVSESSYLHKRNVRSMPDETTWVGETSLAAFTGAVCPEHDQISKSVLLECLGSSQVKAGESGLRNTMVISRDCVVFAFKQPARYK